MTYKVTIRANGEQKTIDVDASKAPFSRDGEPGSLLDIALGSDFEIDHACGGVSACATCHVIVTEGLDSIPDAEEEEELEYDWLRVESAIWAQDTEKLTFRVLWDDNTPSDEIEGSTPTFNEVKL